MKGKRPHLRNVSIELIASNIFHYASTVTAAIGFADATTSNQISDAIFIGIFIVSVHAKCVCEVMEGSEEEFVVIILHKIN